MNREIKFKAWNHIIGRMTEKAYTLQELYSEKVNFTNLIFLQWTYQCDKNKSEIYLGDLVEINRYDKPLIGEIKQLKGGQYYIDHKEVNLKYRHQIHCEVCDTDSPIFFLDFFDAYEIKIVGNIFQNANILN